MRASGILMHISSLPSKYGIGTFGEAAYRFVDFLEAAAAGRTDQLWRFPVFFLLHFRRQSLFHRFGYLVRRGLFEARRN